MESISKEQFVLIIKEHQRIINSLCSLYFSVDEDKKDVRQDIILQLWKSIPDFRNDCKISTWIYKVSLNTILNKLRKEKNRFKTESITNVHNENMPNGSFCDDDVQLLKSAINLLSDVDKAIVILYLEGYHYKEISSALGLSESNVGTRFSRIKNKLYKIFKLKNHELK